MSLLLVRLRLFFYLGFFAFDLVGIYIQHIRPLLWSLAVLIILFLGIGHTFMSTINQVKMEEIAAVSLPERIPHQSRAFTRAELETQLKEYQEVLKTQPNHRDILINIALLQRALHNQKESYLAWEEARKLDPNNKAFDTNTQE